MATKAVIPRFLLPRRSLLWQPTIRNASNKTPPPSKPKVLAKPDKFVPPSHGSKLRQPGGPKITNYGPQLTASQLAQQSKKAYPNMMPPPGTFMHWFLHNRAIHLWISLGTLTTLAIYTLYMSLKSDEDFNQKYGEILMPLGQMFWHPFQWWGRVFEVVRLRGLEVSEETRRKRERSVDDVRKRSEFRKKHGLETEGFGGWTFKSDGEGKVEPVKIVEGDVAAQEVVESEGQEKVVQEKPKRKMWLGIW